MNSFVYCEEAGDLTREFDVMLIADIPPDKPSEPDYDELMLNCNDYPEITGMITTDKLLAVVIKDEHLRDTIISIAKDFKELEEEIETEIDNMYDDWKYDHDNYDSVERERNLKQSKGHCRYLNAHARDLVYEKYHYNPGPVFDCNFGNIWALCDPRVGVYDDEM